MCVVFVMRALPCSTNIALIGRVLVFCTIVCFVCGLPFCVQANCVLRCPARPLSVAAAIAIGGVWPVRLEAGGSDERSSVNFITQGEKEKLRLGFQIAPRYRCRTRESARAAQAFRLRSWTDYLVLHLLT